MEEILLDSLKRQGSQSSEYKAQENIQNVNEE